MMSKLLTQATQGWSADMESRGYATCHGGAAATYRDRGVPGVAGPTSTVLRSARQMKSDMDEEAEMKRMMMERAKAKQ